MKRPMSGERESPERPPRRSAAPDEAPRSAALMARVRWADEGEATEIELDGARGLIVVPVPLNGAERTTMLVEALDRAAPGGRRRVQISRKSLTLELDVPEGWPRAERLPSIVLGSGTRPAASGDEGERRGLQLPPFDPAALDERSAALIREYPRRRRALAAQRRGVETDMVRHDDHVRARRRAGKTIVVVAAASLLISFSGAAVALPILSLAGALVFAVLAAGFAWERHTRVAVVETRVALEARLGRIADWEQQLDARAREIARDLGCKDPWEASARCQVVVSSARAPAESVGDRDAVVARAASLARALGLDAAQIGWDAGWDAPAPAGGRGWPEEVAAGDPDLAAPGSLLRVARLLERADCSLPAVWPLVLFDPWPDHEARERARMMLAIAEVARPRPIVALVSSSR